MIIDVVEGDITRVRADAIVNAANSSLLGGGGVDGAIHRVGGPDILAECKLLRATSLPQGLAEGAAVPTTAGHLPARWVIHTVGPRFSPHEDRSATLRSAYTSSLRVADGLGATTVAFPLVSGGAFGWPVGTAVQVAVAALKNASTRVEVVSLVAFDHSVAQMMRREAG
ncbi:MAG: O-acetyl-ADP-ribose deacetylase [Rhodococcus sp.]|nr:O-acetyl-ADP-ribose deacetylase [Rhodococcus sp. (in: high G+C Gram-positive bacteria)]